MEFHLFLYLAAIFAAGYGSKVLTTTLKIPEVTGYVLLGGVLLGGSLVNLLSIEVLDILAPLSSIALALIAFMIGIELKLDVIKRLGKSIITIVTCESIGAFLVVFFGLFYVFKTNLNTALLLGSVASATAPPAATVAVIKQYKAKGGVLTSSILAVVGIDDAFALIIYVFVESFVSSNLLGSSLAIGPMVARHCSRLQLLSVLARYLRFFTSYCYAVSETTIG